MLEWGEYKKNMAGETPHENDITTIPKMGEEFNTIIDKQKTDISRGKLTSQEVENLQQKYDPERKKIIHWGQEERNNFAIQLGRTLDGKQGDAAVQAIHTLLEHEIAAEVFETKMEESGIRFEQKDATNVLNIHNESKTNKDFGENALWKELKAPIMTAQANVPANKREDFVAEVLQVLTGANEHTVHNGIYAAALPDIQEQVARLEKKYTHPDEYAKEVDIERVGKIAETLKTKSVALLGSPAEDIDWSANPILHMEGAQLVVEMSKTKPKPVDAGVTALFMSTAKETLAMKTDAEVLTFVNGNKDAIRTKLGIAAPEKKPEEKKPTEAQPQKPEAPKSSTERKMQGVREIMGKYGMQLPENLSPEDLLAMARLQKKFGGEKTNPAAENEDVDASLKKLEAGLQRTFDHLVATIFSGKLDSRLAIAPEHMTPANMAKLRVQIVPVFAQFLATKEGGNTPMVNENGVVNLTAVADFYDNNIIGKIATATEGDAKKIQELLASTDPENKKMVKEMKDFTAAFGKSVVTTQEGAAKEFKDTLIAIEPKLGMGIAMAEVSPLLEKLMNSKDIGEMFTNALALFASLGPVLMALGGYLKNSLKGNPWAKSIMNVLPTEVQEAMGLKETPEQEKKRVETMTKLMNKNAEDAKKLDASDMEKLKKSSDATDADSTKKITLADLVKQGADYEALAKKIDPEFPKDKLQQLCERTLKAADVHLTDEEKKMSVWEYFGGKAEAVMKQEEKQNDTQDTKPATPAVAEKPAVAPPSDKPAAAAAADKPAATPPSAAAEAKADAKK